MAEEIITHGLQVEAKQGQNGGLNPSSIHPGSAPIARSKFAKSVISEQGPVIAHAGDWQTRPVSSAKAVPTHPGMRSRVVADGGSLSSGSPGGTVPDKLDYANAPKARRAKK